MAINYAEKYSGKVAERFAQTSLTDGRANKDYEFQGVRSVKVYSVDTVPLGNYSRTGANRYGTPVDLGDTVQELTMTQDKAFTFVIDKGDDAEQLNVKAAAKALRRQIDEVIVPEMDKYRFSVWCKKAGTIASTNAPTANTITGLLMDSTEVLDNAFVPAEGRTLFITTAIYKLLKQNPDFLNVDALAKESLVKGQVGEIDGMKVIRVPSTWLPTGVYWMIAHKSAILSPAKLKEYKIHKDPPGINGNLVEGRVLHDAFVLGEKASAVYTAVNSANITNKPSITDDTTNSLFNISSTTTGASLYYTLDGSDPRYSDTVITYADTVNYAAFADGNYTIKAYAEDATNSKYASAVNSATITAS